MRKQRSGDSDAFPTDFFDEHNTGINDCFTPSRITLNNKYGFNVETEPVISSAYEKSVPVSLYLCHLKTCQEEQKHLKNIRFINETHTLWITLDSLPDELPVPKAIKRLPAKSKSSGADKKPAVIVWPNGHTQPLIGCQIRQTTPEDRELVQLTRIQSARQKTGHRRGSTSTANPSDVPNQRGTQIIDDFKAIMIDGHKIDLSAKHKARAFLRFLYKELHGKARTDFLMDAMREKFNSQFDDSHEGKRWQSDRLREDLFKGVSVSDFDLIFETIDRTNGRYRLKI